MKINNSPNNLANLQNKNNNVAFSGAEKSLLKRGADFFIKYTEPERAGNMRRELFIATAFAFLLSGRLINSRDNNERRETLTRDIPTIVIAVKGVPLFEEWTAGRMQKNTGFAILKNPKKYRDGIACGDQIDDWYRLNNSKESGLQAGLKGFMERLSDQGGNLKKITSWLSPEIKKDIAKLSDDNATFMTDVLKNHSLAKKIETEFAKEGNKALKQASYLKAIPKVVGFIATLSIIGIFIPKLNIFITEMLARKRHHHEHHGKNEAQAYQKPSIKA